LGPGGPGDPRARVVGQPVTGPPLQGHGERVLHRLLRPVEVPQHPDQRGQDPPSLLAEGALDGGTGVRSGGYDWEGPSNSRMGRTSMQPPRAAGIREAASMAWSRFSQLTM